MNPIHRAVCGALLAATVALTSLAHAEAPLAQGQAPGWYRMKLGKFEVTALSDGSYVVTSPDSADTRGTVTWVSGAGPSSGPLTASHTLTGRASGSRIGSGGVVPVGNGNFVVRSHGNGLGSTVDFRAAGSGNATQGAVALTQASPGATSRSSCWCAVSSNLATPMSQP